MNGYLRVAALMPNIKVGNPNSNLESIKEEILRANTMSAKFCVLPELAITGNNLKSLYHDRNILNDTLKSFFSLLTFSSELDLVIVSSFPFEYNNNVYEMTAVIKSGNILGFVPKNKFKDNQKYFSSFNNDNDNFEIFDKERNIQYNFPISENLVFSNEKFNFSIIYDGKLNKNIKSEVVVNISSIPETIDVDSKIRYIRDLSKENNCTIITATSGPSESTDRYAYFGRSFVCENGDVIAKNDIITNHILISDIDLDKFSIGSYNGNNYFKNINFNYSNYVSNLPSEKLFREFDKTPFINQKVKPYNYSMHIINILAIALAKRMNAIKSNDIVIGVSGGLDSTIALLICNKTIEYLSLNSSNIHAYSMPGFGTTVSANSNTEDLLKSLNIKFNVINITNSVTYHLNDISHDINNTNVTFENAQARERTQILMDIANDLNGIVVGTGDLSEIALGYSTYNGDQMSMYNVNASLPKTLIKYILNAVAEENLSTKNNILLANTLKNILHTPISPELLPTENGILLQKTEDIVGNYEIHDFVLYNYLKYNYDIKKILDLTLRTFVYNSSTKNFTEDYVEKCINIFFDRFYKSQYKRIASPDSPDIGLPNLNSSYSYDMPSDNNVDIKL